MTLTILGKGNVELLTKFQKEDFYAYELYLRNLDRSIHSQINSLPSHIKIRSIHNPTKVRVGDQLHSFNLVHPGDIGQESLQVLQKTIYLAKQLGSSKVVIHGAKYDVRHSSKEQAVALLVERINTLDAQGIDLCFETDCLWHNLFYPHRALLTSPEDFFELDRLLKWQLKITADIEHLFLTYFFNQFLQINGKNVFLKKYLNNIDNFENDFQAFIKDKFHILADGFYHHLKSFFIKFKDKIEHLHLNGSDPFNFYFDPETKLPLVGEHLPLGWKTKTVMDRLDYTKLNEIFRILPPEKEIGIVLEAWKKDPVEFILEMRKSKQFLTNYLNQPCVNPSKANITKMTSKTVRIGNREITNYGLPYIIAEIGSNHNGSIELGKQMIDAAIASGADAVKFQAFGLDLFSKVCYEDDPRRAETIESHPVLEKHLTITHKNTLKQEMEQHVASKWMLRAFKEYCDEKGVVFCCTPLNKEVTDYLVDDLGMECIKVASMDVNNLPFLEYLAKKGKPVILSTGMSTLAEVQEAVDTLEKYGNKDIVLLHCVSLYPPQDESVNLNNLDLFRQVFDYPVGFSDHSFGTAIPLAAIAKGACMIEKHFTLDKTLPGWDHRVSADPQEMKVIVEDGRTVWKSLGSYQRILTQEEIEKKALFGRSIVAVRDLQKGEIIAEEDIDYRRPGTGIEPKHQRFVVGRALKNDVQADDLIKLGDLV